MTMEHKPGTRLNPLRLSKTPAEFEAMRGQPFVGVSGSAYPGDEGTVTIRIGEESLDLDVDYAKMVVIMMCDSIKMAKEHNRKLGK